MRTAMLLILAAAGCGDKDPPPTESSGGPVTRPDTGWPDDGDDGGGGTDADGDGWTVEEGDCDDGDIFVNPDRDEVPDDGADNDCDGREDEDFAGLVAVQVGDPHDPSLPNVLHVLSTLGEVVDTIELQDDSVFPYFLTWSGVDDGYVIGDLGTLQLFEVDGAGAVSPLASFKSYKEMWGLTTHPDGYYLVTTGAALHAVSPGSGAITTLAEWDANTELYGFDVDIDPLTGAVGVFGYFGGFATWDGDLTVHLAAGAEAPTDLVVYSGAHRDGGGWYAGAFGEAGFGGYRLDEEAGAWEEVFLFEQDWQPTFFTIDGDTGDFYLAANAATYPTVWRVSADGASQYLFYESAYRSSVARMWDLYAIY